MWRRYLRFWGPNPTADVDEELHFHLETKVQELVDSGLTAAQARTEALRQFGNYENFRKECRQIVMERQHKINRAEYLATLFQDARFALRLLRKNPGFTAVAILALALGIGANTAIFTVVDALLLRPLPYPHAEQLVMTWEARTDERQNVVSPDDYFDWKAQNSVFEGIAAFVPGRETFTGAGEPQELQAQFVSAEFFPLLRASALAGRLFTPEDDRQGAPDVAVISHRLWQQRFGGEANIVGRTVHLNARAATVIGILPPGFYLLSRNVDVWEPLGLNPARNYRKDAGRYLLSIARLKPGVTRAAAQAQMESIARRLEQTYPEFNKGWTVNLVPLREQIAGSVRASLVVLFIAVGCLLLIACANVANLLLARSASRRREFGIRTALGAARGRIVRQVFTESILLSAAAAVAGVAMAYWGTRAFLAIGPKLLTERAQVSVDLRVLGFSLLVAMATGILFGLAPALSDSRTNLTVALRDGARGATRHGAGLRQFFVAAQLSLTVVLLIGAALLLRSFLRLQSVDPGMPADHLLTFRISLPQSAYREAPRRTVFFTEASRRFETLPGVRSASAISYLPFDGMAAGTWVRIAGRPAPRPGEELSTIVRTVLPGYFHTAGIRFLEGRDFTSAYNTPSAPHRFIVNQAFIRKFLPNSKPLDQSISVWMDDTNPYGAIIGVVGDLKEGSLDKGPEPTVYYNHAHLNYTAMTFVVRTAGDPLSLAGSVRAIV